MPLYMNNVYWLCGSSRAGKSTISNIIENKFNFFVYHTDEKVFGEHWNNRANEDDQPAIYKVKSFNNNWEKYYDRDIELVVEESIETVKEGWPFIYNDIVELVKNKPDQKILVEGGSIFPNMLHGVAPVENVVYMIPTKDFQERMFRKTMRLEEGRKPQTEGEFFNFYKDPEFSVSQRVEHHYRMGEYSRDLAEKAGYLVLETEKEDDLALNIEKVLKQFNLN